MVEPNSLILCGLSFDTGEGQVKLLTSASCVRLLFVSVLIKQTFFFFFLPSRILSLYYLLLLA